MNVFCTTGSLGSDVGLNTLRFDLRYNALLLYRICGSKHLLGLSNLEPVINLEIQNCKFLIHYQLISFKHNKASHPAYPSPEHSDFSFLLSVYLRYYLDTSTPQTQSLI